MGGRVSVPACARLPLRNKFGGQVPTISFFSPCWSLHFGRQVFQFSHESQISSGVNKYPSARIAAGGVEGSHGVFNFDEKFSFGSFSRRDPFGTLTREKNNYVAE